VHGRDLAAHRALAADARRAGRRGAEPRLQLLACRREREEEAEKEEEKEAEVGWDEEEEEREEGERELRVILIYGARSLQKYRALSPR